MVEEQRATYPSIPVSHWWALRERFKAKMPSEVTPAYIAVTLNMAESSAKANVMPALYLFGIVDRMGKPMDRAMVWRDDEQYAALCQQIRREIYPQALMDAFPGPTIDRSALERWFSMYMGVGERAAKKMALVYDLLTTADAAEGAKHVERTRPTRRGRPPGSPSRKPTLVPSNEQKLPQVADAAPDIRINLQIQISPEMTPEQIDQMFASIARHLWRRGSGAG